MLIIKPYGRSKTHFPDAENHSRKLHRNIGPQTSLDIADFAKNHPELVLAQWISVIDKIARKPAGNGNPTQAQRDFRERLGKIIHYEACNEGSQADIIKNWPTDVAQSRYWTSDGQAEIKRNEAFVRVWRHVIALAQRTATDWADPGGNVRDDILGQNQRAKATGEHFDSQHYADKVALLFGRRANLFLDDETAEEKNVLEKALAGLSNLRNGAFHFKGRGGFADALVKSLGGSDNVLTEARCLWNMDQQDRLERLRTEMCGSHFKFFFDQKQLEQLVGALPVEIPDHAPLPRYRRVLDRADKAWGRVSKLPKPGNSTDLEVPARLCQYKALQMLYIRAFPTWLEARSHTTLNCWIERAVTRMTEAARKINKDELAVARAANLIQLNNDETIVHFTDRLMAATASEMRVQRGYNSDGEQAKKQSKYIGDLLCDVIVLAFQAWLHEARFGWLLQMSTDQDKPVAALSNLDLITKTSTDTKTCDWQVMLYFLIHLVPVDDVGRLLHQMRKWIVLEGQADDDVQKMLEVFGLYLDMHDAKFEGGHALPGGNKLKSLFEDAKDYDKVFPAQADDGDSDPRVPKRGLREMMRFGSHQTLANIFQQHQVKHCDVQAVLDLEAEKDGGSDIARQQAERQRLHEKWSRNRRSFQSKDKVAYCEALQQVVRHRHLAGQVRLTNHVRLHRLLISVLARLVDFAGLWERDLYFVSLALMYQADKKPDTTLDDNGQKFLAAGRIVNAVDKSELKTDLKDYFVLIKEAKSIRNNLAHFNMLRLQPGNLNITGLINDTRKLMAYDRKLKNAVSKSVRELLYREGLDICWRMTEHELQSACVKTRQATHLGQQKIRENLHGDAYVEMVASLFCGKAKTTMKDVRHINCCSLGSKGCADKKRKNRQKNHRNHAKTNKNSTNFRRK